MERYLAAYEDAFEAARIGTKWKVTDSKVTMAIASFYAMNRQPLDPHRFQRLAGLIKKEAGLFSAMRSQSRFLAAAILDVSFDDACKRVDDLFAIYNELIKAKFQRGVYTYIAASVLMQQNKPDSPHTSDLLSKAKEIYHRMKEAHSFLINVKDYPFAMLLASYHPAEIVDRSEAFYEQLSLHGFSKGSCLQTLSHILALEKGESRDAMVKRTVRIYDLFPKAGFKPKRQFYPTMGILAMIPPGELNMNTVSDIYGKLKKNKHFRWQKDLNIMLSAAFYVKDKMESSSLLQNSLYTTIETILHAQLAVMVASVTATAVSNSPPHG